MNRIFFYYDKTVWSTDSRVKTYQELPDNSLDVLFLGSSNLMSGVNPVQLWEETGIQSYDYCSRAQTFPFAYEYLKDALKTQTPRCVVLDAYSVLSDNWYNGLANSDFHFGINMDNLSLDSKMELVNLYVDAEDRLSYIFPLIKNHNYYKTWDYTEDVTDQIFMGYCFADSSEYFETPIYTDAVTPMTEIDDTYLRKIIGLCQEKDIDLYVIKTPVVYSDEEHSVLNAVKNVCEEYGVDFYDMSLDAAAWGFDFQSDMLNFFHNNSTGAVKITSRIGEILTEKYDFSESDTHQYSDVWEAEDERMIIFRTPDEEGENEG
jgi:hypothetical protein